MEDFAPEEYLEHMRIYLKALDDDIKTEEALYGERLQLCAKCEDLLEGLCRKCGCYVEYRAAIRKKHCPGVPPSW